jgi:hypothetical protein
MRIYRGLDSFIQTGAGAVARTLRSKLTGWVELRDFSGADASEQCQAAIDSLPAEGGVVDGRILAATEDWQTTVDVGTKKVYLLVGATTFSTTIQAFSFGSGGSLIVVGIGSGASVFDFLDTSGYCFDFDSVDGCSLSGLAITNSPASGTAQGVRLYKANNTILRDLIIDGFARPLNISGDATTRSFNTHCESLALTNCRSIGINVDHAVDTYFSNVQNWGASGNPATGSPSTRPWAFVMDTGASGVYINNMSILEAGFKIQNSAPSAAAFDQPPEYLKAVNLLVDTVTGTDCILLDSTLSTADIPYSGRIGKSYRFVLPWACFTQTDGKSGIRIDGGVNITIQNPLLRLNRLHGMHIAGGHDIRVYDIAALGNNQQAGAGDGLHVDGGVTGFSVDGGRCGNGSGEAGNQVYGINLAAGVTDNFSLENINCSDNSTGGLFDGSTGVNKRIDNVKDDADDYIDKFHASAAYRMEIGDANFFLDFLMSNGSAVAIQFDGTDVLEYRRDLNQLALTIGGTTAFVNTAAGMGVGAGPSADSILALTSSSKGFLLPRLTTTQRDAIASPTDGLMVYNTTTGFVNCRQGGVWQALAI